MPEYHLAKTFRTESGKRRITYRPDWSKETPWASYFNLTAGRYFTSVASAQLYYKHLNDPLIITNHD
jgi:hypothetical protein